MTAKCSDYPPHFNGPLPRGPFFVLSLSYMDDNQPISVDHHMMLPEEEANSNNLDDEKSSIEKKSVYEDLVQKEHFFSKAKLEASSEFEQEMHKQQEEERRQREEFIAKQKQIEKIKKEQQFTSVKPKVSESDIRVRKGIISTIATEILFVFVFVPNFVIALPPIVNFVLITTSIMTAIISVIVLTMTGNIAENHCVPKKENALFWSAAILPGAALRTALVMGCSALFSFIPVAGPYIGCSIGAAVAAAIHYAYIGHFRIKLPEVTSLINAAAAVLLLIIPNMIAGAVNQPIDQKAQFGFYVYIFEGVFIILADEIMFKLHQARMKK